MRALVASAIAGLIALVISPAALASGSGLQPGVHVDPGSPAGKEYQIPLSGARSETAGSGQSGSQNPPLFGVGVTPAAPSSDVTAGASSAPANQASSTSSAASSGTSGTHASSRHRVASSTSAAAQPLSAAGGSVPVSAAASGGAGNSAWIPLVAGGLLVLVLGGGGGLALRQRLLRG